ncbi:hypothetical protein GCM10010116_21790 [Microbispora rosea subsp. aerata]|nr:hypothetical protein GCM10010116_21790 [Microbispora rosea subsp. aerata]GIH53638.1 hypothetical protein Mro02_05520 [Microbispora rosea subsp. aerata]GLJ81631.1 hypothetical protein GCM10017588_03560 [Microbispora rosea subsp. aerata]
MRSVTDDITWEKGNSRKLSAERSHYVRARPFAHRGRPQAPRGLPRRTAARPSSSRCAVTITACKPCPAHTPPGWSAVGLYRSTRPPKAKNASARRDPEA